MLEFYPLLKYICYFFLFTILLSFTINILLKAKIKLTALKEELEKENSPQPEPVTSSLNHSELNKTKSN